jgi:hypothetical protein
MSEAYELIEAIYGPEGWEENKIENPKRYNSLLKETTGKHAIYGKGFILGIVREPFGRPIVCEVVAGCERGLRYFYNLQAENGAAQKLCEIYFTIAANAIGEDEVRNQRDQSLQGKKGEL